MCDKESFAKLRDQIFDLSKETVAQAEQIKTLFATTERQGQTMQSAFNRMLWLFGIIATIAILALVYGALGPHGFNAVARGAGLEVSARRETLDASLVSRLTRSSNV